MVSRRRSTKTSENRAVTPPGSVGRDSPRSRKCLDLEKKESQPLTEINGWTSSTKGTPSKKAQTSTEPPPTPGSPDIFARTPACPSSPGIIPRTPAAVAGWSYTNLGTPRSALSGGGSRRSLLITPQRRHSSSNTPRRSNHFVMPDQFRLTPSTMKKEKKSEESPETNLPKIQSRSFYGGGGGNATKSSAEKNKEVVKEKEKETPSAPEESPSKSTSRPSRSTATAVETSTASTSSTAPSTSKTPPSAALTSKTPTASSITSSLVNLKSLETNRAAFSEPRKVSRPVIKRETSASKLRRGSFGSGGGGVKRKRDGGVNKGGFGHGIKRPKKKQRYNIKVSEMTARSIEIPGSKVNSSNKPTTPSTPSTSKPSSSSTNLDTPKTTTANQTPTVGTPKTPSAAPTPKSGSLAMSGRKDSGVKYTLKGGQLVYRKSTPIRKSPRKHMSPMKASYFSGEKPKPPKSRRSGGRLFSPANDYMRPDVMSPEKKIPSPVKRVAVSPVKFTHMSTDDDEEEEQTNNISDLINRLEVEDDEVGVGGGLIVDGKVATPPPALSKDTLNNSGMELDLQSGDIAAMTINTGGGFVDLDAEITAYNAVQDILGTLQDTNSSVESSTTSNQMDVVTDGADNSKLFPIFYKETAQPDAKSPSHDKTKGRRTFVCKDPRQLVLDAGQDRGPTLCLTCGAVYTKGNPEDESSHQKTHNEMKEKLKFPGWRKERKCDEDLDGRILIVQPGDNKHMWKKVHDVLSIVDRDLGFAEPGKIRKPDQSKVFLYVCEKQVVGFVLAETIEAGFRVIPQQDDESSKTYTCSTEEEAAKLGISRIWVHPDFRKKGIATKLVENVRNFFILGQVIKKDELAFSDPTMNGMEFAGNYSKRRDFLVYR